MGVSSRNDEMIPILSRIKEHRMTFFQYTENCRKFSTITGYGGGGAADMRSNKVIDCRSEDLVHKRSQTLSI